LNFVNAHLKNVKFEEVERHESPLAVSEAVDAQHRQRRGKCNRKNDAKHEVRAVAGLQEMHNTRIQPNDGICRPEENAQRSEAERERSVAALHSDRVDVFLLASSALLHSKPSVNRS
jgi:hypothetical protein